MKVFQCCFLDRDVLNGKIAHIDAPTDGKSVAFFPRAHGVPRVDERRVISGIMAGLRHGLQWKDAPKGVVPHKTGDNRFVR